MFHNKVSPEILNASRHTAVDIGRCLTKFRSRVRGVSDSLQNAGQSLPGYTASRSKRHSS